MSTMAWLDNGHTTGVGWSWVANELIYALVWLGGCFRVSWVGDPGSFNKWLVGGEEMWWVWLMMEVPDEVSTEGNGGATGAKVGHGPPYV